MRGILFDLDGVFYVGERAIPGAAETLDWVRQQQIPHCFLTNTSSKPRDALVAKLARLGLAADADHILTPPVAASSWIAQNLNGSVVLFVPDDTEAEFARLTLADRQTQEPVAAVVVGDLGDAWDFTTLNQAFRLLMRQPSPRLIALGMTRYWRAPDGLRLDVAPFVHALQYASGIEPVVLGKPCGDFYRSALEMIVCKAEQSVMVGDDIRGDIAAAQAVGLQGLLVHTGKFQTSDLAAGITPDGQLASIAEFPEWWGRITGADRIGHR
ncbi:MAG: haloacid dehalogenase [gamma proteobacterium symbiont of Ctena orbiculata]|nr:TIGR01458 family HAD-type hydrolase [Candidatus Thiodiazotropha taylori]PUB84920.1 MAG: TIGR01458 family HAD-type hydrolase [gamma proteobacterium symbiont of Ctena orbiculata]MBT2997961.1 TIGR01458 family HAD-type hydrolase [Candidatus Thiodiazotropha taylori]MBT3001749.1 TIGR01458 family HAD-type hydrolase [Candidatus Thiodiazotropha taylori]MBV2107606.1 TIGR01458 family HAD-type hydrolase [Candidatus Thiodiazotropha taylori]